MSIVVRSRESWLATTLRPNFRSSLGVREWVQNEHWTPLAGMTRRRMLGTIHSLDEYSEACIRDSIKLSIAAFESAIETNQVIHEARSCAWHYIKYYYAAYFAANALMRLRGMSCINLTAIDCVSINSWALANGVGGTTDANRLVAGLYIMQLDGAVTPTFALRLGGGKGGVHIQFWISFSAFLASLRDDLASSPAPKVERDAAALDLTLLESELQRGGLSQGSWLSEMRNAVNYRFEYGTWFPYVEPSLDVADLKTSFRVHASNATRFAIAKPGVPELLRAARVCGYLVGWLRNSLEIVSATAKGEKGMLLKGALNFANKI